MDGTLQRQAERFEAPNCRLELWKGGFLGLGRKTDIGGRVLDLSETGLRFEAAERPPLSSPLKAVLRLGAGGPAIEARVVVRWASGEPGERIVAGAEFDALDAAARERIGALRKLIESGGAA